MNNKKYKNKYRIDSARLKNYDYSSNGMYFVTIVTKNRIHFFGEIVNGKMVLNNIGKIVLNEWKKSEKIRDHIFLDEFVIMPNHFHGIVVIDDDRDCDRDRRDVLQNVSTTPPAKPSVISTISPTGTNDISPSKKNEFFVKISPSSKSLSMMIRQFKSAVTRKIRDKDVLQNVYNFAWQPRFHDHIICDNNELNRIRQYIIANPKIWERDRNN